MDNEMTSLAAELLALLTQEGVSHSSKSAYESSAERPAPDAEVPFSSEPLPSVQRSLTIEEISEGFERASRCYDSHFELY